MLVAIADIGPGENPLAVRRRIRVVAVVADAGGVRVAVTGAGLGIVDIFDTNGHFVKTLVPAGGALNAPWCIALAPADFGGLSNMLLVGNLGDGKINGYDPTSGHSTGPLVTASGTFAVPGLWGIAFGNDAASQPHNTLFYAAGTNGYANGVYGRIDLQAQ